MAMTLVTAGNRHPMPNEMSVKINIEMHQARESMEKLGRNG
jgi:hypothetical protein